MLFRFNDVLGRTTGHDPVRINLEIPVPGFDIRYGFPKILVVTDSHVNSINTAKRHLIKDGPGPVAVLQTINSDR
ncbi:uncharacterized protein METZ01_LOCUS73694 [marine metagenome]|uniref:Uncharacterized protein n=1 Tax=marine metagenome TaxID=408172 RepID=A0A381TXW4_9ZZZZ